MLQMSVGRTNMDEEALNTSVRKFLRKFGVMAQRELESAVRAADAKGQYSHKVFKKMMFGVAAPERLLPHPSPKWYRMATLHGIGPYPVPGARSPTAPSAGPCCGRRRSGPHAVARRAVTRRSKLVRLGHLASYHL
jgi:Family of unknown function (DUF6494)